MLWNRKEMVNRALFLNYSICVSLSVYFPTIGWRALSINLLESSNKAILYRSINSGCIYGGISDFRISDFGFPTSHFQINFWETPEKKNRYGTTRSRSILPVHHSAFGAIFLKIENSELTLASVQRWVPDSDNFLDFWVFFKKLKKVEKAALKMYQLEKKKIRP